MNKKSLCFEQEDLGALAKVMKALASPVRLEIVAALGTEGSCLCELQPRFQLDKSTLCRHIAALKNAGIVSEHRVGNRVRLQLATPCILNVFQCAMAVLRVAARKQARSVPYKYKKAFPNS